MSDSQLQSYVPGAGYRTGVADYREVNNLLLSFFICSFVTLLFLSVYDALFHWFIIPVFLCGVIIGSDAVAWVRGQLDIFDPIGLLGLFGVYFFFLAPILHVVWGVWLKYVDYPADWRFWLGCMAVLNFLGLLIYRFTREKLWRRKGSKIVKKTWVLEEGRFAVILIITLILTAALQLWVYSRYGGISGYIHSVVDVTGAFRGMGWIFMISESFPILLLIGFAVYSRKHAFLKSWPAIFIALVVFMGLQMLFGGLRGSRSTVIFSTLWAIGIIHFIVRKFSKTAILVILVFFIAFMFVYGFYKSSGVRVFEIASNPKVIAELEQKSGRTLPNLLLEDLGRSDVQAFILYRLTRPESDYEYSWGRTYIGAAEILLPNFILPTRTPTKIKEGTEALYGKGSFSATFSSSLVYGLTGEAMLNFGPIVVPLVFILLGFIVFYVRRLMLALTTSNSFDSRLLFLPLLAILCIVILTSDSDNVIFFIVKMGFVPFLVVLLGSKRRLSE